MKKIKNRIQTQDFLPRSSLNEFQWWLKKEDKKRNKELQKRILKKWFSAPIYIWANNNNYILDWHQRLKALNALAEKWYLLDKDMIPVVHIIADTLEEAKESVLEYNSRYAEFDMDELMNWADGLDLDGIDLWFELPELEVEDQFNEAIEDVIPELQVHTHIKEWDIFMVGNHRIMCGDTTNSEHVALLMGEELVDLIWTDPPYNVDYKGHGAQTQNGIRNDNMDSDAFCQFLTDAFVNLNAHKKPSAGVYLWHNHKEQNNFSVAAKTANREIKQQLVRNKPSLWLGGGDYRPKHELCFYCASVGQKNNFYGDRANATVITTLQDKSDEQLLTLIRQWKKAEEQGKTTVLSIRRDNVNEYVHPTQKPVELCTISLQNNTHTGDIILDGFLWSGVTLITAEKLGRRCYGMELDPRYMQVILQRYYDVTGKTDIRCLNRPLELSDLITVSEF